MVFINGLENRLTAGTARMKGVNKLMDMKPIPVCEPTLSHLETQYVLDAMRSGWISSSGAYLSRFEREFPDLVGARYGVAVCNGTVALHLALKALGIGPGDEVILPSFTMVASANAVSYCGARPVFVDADPNTWTIDTAFIEAAITQKTKAIMTVTIYGHPSDFGAIGRIARQYSLKWIEDAAEGHGALFQSKPLAHYPDVTTYSFYANKIITTGEGGMVCTNDSTIFDTARFLKNLGFPLQGERSYVHSEIGFNYRMTNIQAAIGCAQMERFDELVLARRRNAERYTTALSQLEDYIQLPVEKPWARNCYWMYGVALKHSYRRKTRDTVMAELKAQGIDTRAFFSPMHTQPIYQTGQSLPVSEWLGSSGFYLPSAGHLSGPQMDAVVRALQRSIYQAVQWTP